MVKRVIKVFIVAFTFLLLTVNGQDKSDVYMQGFYWNSPPGGIWWDSLARLAPRLASAGFNGIWFPSPIKGAGGGFSMGYDPYDHYDFGEFNQKGSRETRFGSRQELIRAIQAYRALGIEVYADAVMNHMNGGEALIPVDCKPYPSYPDSAYMLFDYPNGSGRFRKNASHFYPNQQTCDVNPPYHGASNPIFQFGYWLAKDKQSVRDSLIEWGKYLKNTLGFSGFRLDAVKSIDPAFMGAWLQAVNGNSWAVAEYYGSTSEIISWFNQCQNVYGGNVAMFDFPLRFTLRDMCNNISGGFDMTLLDGAGLINSGMSGFDVSTWVENHDVDRIGWDGQIDDGHDPILYNKDLAYSYIMFSEGRPTVFFKDYFDYGFAGKIDTLIWIRQKFLGGGTSKRSELNAYYIRQDGNQDQTLLSRDIYVARRNGFGSKPGGYLVMNDNSTQWIDVWVDTELPVGTKYKDYTGKDVNKTVVPPAPGGVKNRVKLWAPPRSYTIYVADTTQSINHPPVLSPIPDLQAYTNSLLRYKLNVVDADNNSLTYLMSGNPSWLNVLGGYLTGTPSFSDTGISVVILKVQDTGGLFAVDTFVVSVLRNLPPQIAAIPDTTVKATKRFEYTAVASDPDADSLSFSLKSAPVWLNIGIRTGTISGTPSVSDTGLYVINVLVTDGKGAYDSTKFNLRVKENVDSIILTFGKPFIDGNVNVGNGDWLSGWQISFDPDTDSYWRPADSLDNEIMGIFATWDADSLYIGLDYVINDNYNTAMIYIDAGITGGVTNFNSNQGYNGDYAKNFRFRPADAIDLFIADYYLNNPSVYKIDGNTSVNITDTTNGLRGVQGNDLEVAISWNDIYGLGSGKVLPGAQLKFVALVAGGFNYGAGDSSPDNPDVDGNAGPDSLINLASINPDLNGDGFPDPTIILSEKDDKQNPELPSSYVLKQNYPNPFNPVTVIEYSLPVGGFTELAIYDILGSQVAILESGFRQAGNYSVHFDASGLSTGIYFYKLTSGSFSAIKKLLLIK